MKLKKILRMVWIVIYWMLLGHLIAECILGENTLITNIAIGTYIINIVLHIIKYILDRFSYHELLKNFRLVFYYMKQSHKARYNCLLCGDTNGAKEHEKLMYICRDALLKVGPSIVEDKQITKKERKEVQEIIDKINVLITTIQPPI